MGYHDWISQFLSLMR